MSKFADTISKRFGLSSSTGIYVPLKSIKVDVSITGYVAEVSSSLTYFNEETIPVEAVFTFPVDDGSAVFQFEADIDGRHIVAEIQEKEQAKLTYKDAIEHGKTAMLLKEDNSAGDIFSCMLGNLPPESEAVLVMKYVIELYQEPDGKLRFTLPTVLNPRYSSDFGGLTPAEGASYIPPKECSYDFDVCATIQGYHKIKSVTSISDKIHVEPHANNVVMVKLCRGFRPDHDFSFLVQYDVLFAPQVILEKGNPKADGLFKQDMLMISFHPDLHEVTMATCGEYIFIIDRSGSMDGNRIEQAKAALILFLKSLPSNCFFNVVSFGSFYNLLFPIESAAYTTEAVDNAIELGRSMTADMFGTEISKPLKHVLSMEPVERHPRRVFILTDGEVEDEELVIGMVSKLTHNSDTRVFSLGIGEGVSTTLVKGVANNGGGRAAFIRNEENIKSKVIHLLRCAMQPSVLELKISLNLPPYVTYLTIPTELPTCILPQERLTVFAILQGLDKQDKFSDMECSVSIEGQRSGEPVSYNMTFTLDDKNYTYLSAPVHHLAVKTQISELEDVAIVDLLNCDDTVEIRQQIIAFSCLGNVLSKYTAFVAIDEKGNHVVKKALRRSCPVPTVTGEFRHGLYVREQQSLAEAGRVIYRMKLKKGQTLDDEEKVAKGSESSIGMRSRSSWKKKLHFHVKLPKISGLFSKWRRSRDSQVANIGDTDQAGSTKVQADLDLHWLQTLFDIYPSVGGEADSQASSDIAHAGSSNADTCGERKSDVGGEADSQACSDIAHAGPSNADTCGERKSDDAGMLSVISLQQLDGHWEMSDNLLKLLDMTAEQIQQLNISHDQDVVYTILVICWLRKHFSTSKDEWQMIERKAMIWLESHDLPSQPELLIQQTYQQL